MDDTPPPVPPDAKDWTWVLEQPCPDCGFVASELDVMNTGPAVRSATAKLVELLDDPRVGARPSPDRWSALEYACHVRDVYRIYDHRLHRMLEEDDPLYANWAQDETAVTERYWAQDAQVVATELEAAADAVATTFDTVTTDQLGRPGRRSDGSSFTIETFARYFLHDPVHHVWDVEQGYAELA